MKRVLFAILAAFSIFSCSLYDDGEKNSGIYMNGKLVKRLSYANDAGFDPTPESSSYTIWFYEKYFSIENVKPTFFGEKASAKFLLREKNDTETYSISIYNIAEFDALVVEFNEDEELIENPIVASASLETDIRVERCNITATISLVDGRIVKLKYDGPKESSHCF